MVFHKQRQRYTITYQSWNSKLVAVGWVGRRLLLWLINLLSSSFRIKAKLVSTADKKDLLKLSQVSKKNKDFLCLVLASGLYPSEKQVECLNVMFLLVTQPFHRHLLSILYQRLCWQSQAHEGWFLPSRSSPTSRGHCHEPQIII